MGRVSLSFLRGTVGEEEASADQGAGGRRSLSAGDKSPINSLPSPPPPLLLPIFTSSPSPLPPIPTGMRTSGGG